MMVQPRATVIEPVGPGGVGPPTFEPHPCLRGGHAQTIAGRFWPAPRGGLPAACREIDLNDGDRLVMLDSVPPGWEDPRPSAVLVHGLAGCAEAPYLVRLALRLVRLGIRVVRVNLRGAGAGFGLARGIYHAGRSDDLRPVLAWLRAQASRSPIALVGFSLGANLVLKLAAEAAEGPVEGLDCVLAANPPLDLAACARHMARPENRLYDRSFVRWLRTTVRRLHRRFPELGPVDLDGVKTLYQFDDRYTARRNGFRSADDYYRRCSLLTALERITVPGLIVHAMDDPFIPPEPFEHIARPSNLALELVRHGGHLGYISRRPWQGDRRWLDARLSGWLAAHWAMAEVGRSGVSRRDHPPPVR
jgi:predicted alpha/beta-fold hydrolase